MTIPSDQILIEGMTSVSAVINSIIAGVSDRRITKVYISDTIVNKKSREVNFLHHSAGELGYDTIIVKSDQLSEITAGNTHGGIAAICTERHFPAVAADALPSNGIFALLDGIEDPFNYAYTVRSLYAAGFDGIVLPPRNWMSAAGTVIKSSAGTSELMTTYVDDPISAVKCFKKCGYNVVCAGIRDSVSLFEANLKKPLLLIIGGEKRGISRSLLGLSDVTVRIDYGRRFLGSLTTASSASVIAFEIMRQNR